jgi:hypothetical protein
MGFINYLEHGMEEFHRKILEDKKKSCRSMGMYCESCEIVDCKNNPAFGKYEKPAIN